MAYTIAGIDVHKRMLAVVVSELAADAEDAFERRPFGRTPAQLRLLAAWLSERQVDEVVMESTAQYWGPVWTALERHWTPPARARAGADLSLVKTTAGPPSLGAILCKGSQGRA